MSHQQSSIGSSARTRIHNITGEQIQALLAKLDVLWETTLPLPLRQEELLSPEFYTPGEAAGGKHVLQEASILGHLKRIGALTDDTTRAIELGAGTARLSDRLSRVALMDHVLIDRQEFSPASCRDRHLLARLALAAKQQQKSTTTTTHTVERVTADIASLDLDKYLTPKCLCLSKHLCGPACDLAIGSMARVSPSLRRPPCAVATCCHYLCTWETFSGKTFWETMGLTQEDFVVAVAASQWASVNKKQQTKNTPLDNDNDKEDAEEPSKKKLKNGVETDTTKPLDTTTGTTACWLADLYEIAKTAKCALDSSDSKATTRAMIPSEEFERTFSRAEKSALGWKVKQLLDLCRAARLQELGYNVDLVVYTTRSLEDRLLVASQSN
jgi:tRNA:m4X modification enzyme